MMTVVMALAYIIGIIACRFGDASIKDCRPSVVLSMLVSVNNLQVHEYALCMEH